ncbi:MAG: PKD domain-containing protein [Bacteroidota bacterium]
MNRKKIFTLFTFYFFLSQFSFAPAQECGYIYITPGGASSGTAGTKSNPADLPFGLSLVSPSDNIIRMASGTYNISSELNMQDNLTIEGGFNSTTWAKSNMSTTIIHRDNNNILTSPNRLIAISCIGISTFRILDITINMDDAFGDGVTAYGIYLSGCSDYIISRCIINAGNGSDGFTGTPGANGMNGADGLGGESGQEEGNCCKLGGAGGSGSFAGNNAGGVGGLGAERGGFSIDSILGLVYVAPGSDYTNPGSPGYPGLGLGGSAGGNGGAGLCELQYYVDSCYIKPTNHGETGQNGVDGTAGSVGTQGVAVLTAGFYIPGTGTIGTDGIHAGGGGGGGGGGAKGCEPAVIDPLDGDTISYVSGSGGGGGGGGEGGQSGFAGSGGYGGGSSFAVFIWSNGANGVIRDCVTNPGPGGSGGAGGPGGAGGTGGSGGQGGKTGLAPDLIGSCNTGEGGNGGTGGTGGTGGAGGTGSDGVSMDIYQDPAGYPILFSDSYNPFEPEITVEYSGCSNTDFIFSVIATGNINWIFGFGANPATGSGANETVQYDNGNPGFRTITLIVDGTPYSFANFINITQDFTPPEITATALTICTSDGIDFSTSSTALSYNWTIPGGSITSSTQQNPGYVTFNNPGAYNITLETTSCCGTSFTELEITVLSSVAVNIGSDTSICFTDTLPVLDAGNPGATYSWTLDGSPVGGNSQTLQTSTPGIYSVNVSYGSCSQSDTMIFDIYTSLPVDLGGDTAICTTDPFPVLDAGIPGMASYMWELDGNPVGTNTQTLQTTIPGTYEVTVISPTGCTGTDALTLSISEPTVDLGVNLTICDNEPNPVLNAGNPGSDYIWELNGIPLGSNTQSFQTTSGGTYSVTVINQYGCTAQDDMVLTVLPSLAASFTAPASTTVNATVSFTDNSSPPPTIWNWNFGDGSLNDSTQNPTHTYPSAGEYPLFLIVSNGICFDTALSTIDVLNDCASFGLVAGFIPSSDTVDIEGLGMVTFTNTCINSSSWEWDFGDGSQISTLQNPTHAYVDTGIYYVTLTAYNYNCSDFATDIIVVIKPEEPVDTTVGMNELQVASCRLQVYPNPNNGQFTIEANPDTEQELDLKIINIMGQKVEQNYISLNKDMKYDVSLPGKGIYFVKLRSLQGFIIKKVIVY